MTRNFMPISPTIWRSKRVRALADRERLLLFYLLTCRHQNSAGCFFIPQAYALSDLGWDAASYIEALNHLVEAGLIAVDADTEEILAIGHFQFNFPASQTYRKSVEKLIEAIRSECLRDRTRAALAEAESLRSAPKLAPISSASGGKPRSHGRPESDGQELLDKLAKRSTR